MTDRRTEAEDGDPLLVTIDEAARRLSIGRSHIYQQMRRGALRSIHIGRSRRILESDLVQFIDNLLNGPVHIVPDDARLAFQPPVKRILSTTGRR